jgi:hypothetical protein
MQPLMPPQIAQQLAAFSSKNRRRQRAVPCAERGEGLAGFVQQKPPALTGAWARPIWIGNPNKSSDNMNE